MSETKIVPPEISEISELIFKLDRWANARERRNGVGGHGETGTKLLRDAASALRRLVEDQ